MLEFFRFELQYWLRGYMVYIFTGLMAFMFATATYSDNLQIGGAIGNTFRNAPFVIQQYYAIAGLLGALIITTFFDSAASRDFSTKFADVLFTKPIRKWDYLIGRFLAASCVALLPMLGISLGIIIAGWLPNRDLDRWCDVHWLAHGLSIISFAIPNILFIGAIVFAIATWTRSTLYSFLAVLGLLVAYSVALSLVSELSNETFAALADPMGATAFGLATKYWTPDQRNTWALPLSGWLLANRMLWLAVSAGVFSIAGWRFRFETVAKNMKRSKQNVLAPKSVATTHGSLDWPVSMPNPRWLTQWFSSIRMEAWLVLKSPAFVIILCFSMLNAGLAIFFSATEGFGVSSLPVTYKMVDIVRGSLTVFVIAILAYFSGVLVWKDRDNRIHEISGAAPVSNSVLLLSHIFSLMAIVLTIHTMVIGLCCLAQLINGYTRFQFGLYFVELTVIDGARFFFLLVIALAAHTISPNKYIGYFGFIGFVIANNFVWQLLRVETLLVRFGRFPSYTYSDLFGFAPYTSGIVWFVVYWGFVSGCLLWLIAAALHRGTPKRFFVRLRSGLVSSSTSSRALFATMLLASICTGGWLYYNTQVLNTLLGSEELEKRRADYERQYSSLADTPQPKISKVRYEIDLYPSVLNMEMRGTLTLENRSGTTIEMLYLNTAPTYDTEISIPGASIVNKDDRLSVISWQLDPPMEPMESREMRFVVRTKNRGIENQVSDTSIVQNGSFFNTSIVPSFGYNPNLRILDPIRRKKLGLQETQAVPDLTRECGPLCLTHYIGSDADFVDVETVISTSPDQIAVAPGSLIKNWTEGERKYYQYKLDHPSLNFYSFISARYEVERSKWGDVEVEVYYHPEHRWNVPGMVKGVQDSLSYCSKNFGPYMHKQARIIEFPRVASFAQAFPGTMPYSESIGFIANLKKPDDIDMVYYIVCHEIAHQWWAHQVIGARMQGATLLSETLAQYTALMIMKKEFGEDMMHKFLRYEMNNYLRSRGLERMKERPLLNVDPNQGYIHYQKGSLAIYYLTEMIGEDRVNAALKELIDAYAYTGPPYPNSYELIDRLKKHTPPDLQYLIRDLFEEITIFDNRTLDATVTKIGDSRYRVSLEVECHKWKADEKGRETETDMDDWVEVGAYGKPAKGNRYGKLLHSERHLLSTGKHRIEFETEDLPYQAGIDPKNLLIDRIADDNLKTVRVESDKR
ncbi:M1 family aminopeptidase [Pirellulaceae bacterium SH449]